MEGVEWGRRQKSPGRCAAPRLGVVDLLVIIAAVSVCPASGKGSGGVGSEKDGVSCFAIYIYTYCTPDE